MMNAISVRFSKNPFLKATAFLLILVLLLACSLGGALQASGAEETSVPGDGGDSGGQTEIPTPTPTLVVQEVPPTPPTSISPCSGLSGELEVQVLVGPAEAVGLEPYSVGTIPFSVTTDETPYLVSGGGQLVYADMLVEEWGSYSVDLVMDTIINGECEDTGTDGELVLAAEMTGTQMVEVIAEDFHGEYPWEGSIPFDLVFPLEEGASIDGEGWAFILHLPAK